MRYMTTLIICLCAIKSSLAQVNAYAEQQVLTLQEQLLFYQKIKENDWTYFPCEQYLMEGDRSVWVPWLRKNLLLTKDLDPTIPPALDSTLFDASIEDAIKRFQRRHNLLDDGIFGAQTSRAMNVPLSERRKQIQRGIIKWKEFAQIHEQTYLLINLPDFSLSIIDSGTTIQRMKAIIGKRTHPTLAFYSELSYLVIHPTWIIPGPIAVNEILPFIKSDNNYLHKNKIEVFTYRKSKRIKLNSDTIQWHKINKENFNYELEQAPGPWNALGLIKFMFPNEYNIYIHDTPEKHLFNYNKRPFTHGCIRIENPEDLAAWLLKKSNDEIKELVENSMDDTIFPLNQTICTFIDHMNVWVDEEGLLHFREEVYPNSNK